MKETLFKILEWAWWTTIALACIASGLGLWEYHESLPKDDGVELENSDKRYAIECENRIFWADYYRFNKPMGEVVFKGAESQDLYIVREPVKIHDVSNTRDYLNFKKKLAKTAKKNSVKSK